MQAGLFYIELTSLPSFYSSPEICSVQVHCRIPPGHALLDLLFKLRREKRYFYYRGSELEETKGELCTEDVLSRCQSYGPFIREIRVEALSTDTKINIDMDGDDGRYSISKCPYRISDLIRDQGLDDVFGRRGQKLRSDSSQGLGSVEATSDRMELYKLLEALNTSYSKQ